MRYGTLVIDNETLEAALKRGYQPPAPEYTPSFLEDREALEEDMWSGIDRHEPSSTWKERAEDEWLAEEDLKAAA